MKCDVNSESELYHFDLSVVSRPDMTFVIDSVSVCLSVFLLRLCVCVSVCLSVLRLT